MIFDLILRGRQYRMTNIKGLTNEAHYNFHYE